MPSVEEIIGQDAADSTSTIYTVPVGSLFRGTLDGHHDTDWIRVELVEGNPYQISLDSTEDNPETDLILRVVNSEGKEVASNDDIDFAAGNLNSQVRFFLDEPGVYFIIADSFRGNPAKQTWGAYSLVVSDRGMRSAEDSPSMGSEDDDVLIGSDADDELTGGKGDDWLIGEGGSDTLSGGTGNDFVSYRNSIAGVEVSLSHGIARGGDAEGDRFDDVETVIRRYAGGETDRIDVPDVEHLVGSERGDRLEGSYAGNWLFGRAGADELDGGAGDDRLYGGAGDDRLYGRTGDDRLTGNTGADILVGGEGADLLRGGAGIDVSSYENSNIGIIVRLYDGTAKRGHAEGDRFTGYDVVEYLDAEGELQQREVPDIEDLVGSAFDDVLIGDLRDNRLEGGAGNDVLRGDSGDGTGGDDLLRGGPGADRLYGGVGNDVLEGGPGADRFWGGAGYDFVSYQTSADGVEIHLYDGTARGGDAEGDRFVGTEEVEYADAGGETRQEAIPDIEHVIGSTHADALVGTRVGNWLFGLAGADELDGREGDDWLEGGGGGDLLRGGAGIDVVSFRDSASGVTVRLHSGVLEGGDAEGDRFAGYDVVEYLDAEGELQQREVPDIEDLVGSAFDDILAGDLRDNRLDGGAGDDTLYGGLGGGDDLLRGGPGADRLYGGVGNDVLEGGPGADRLHGGPGADKLYGGAGADIFIFAPGDGNDYISDFRFGDDRVDLTAFEDVRTPGDLDIIEQEEDLVIDLSGRGGGQLTLYGINDEIFNADYILFFSGDSSSVA